MSSTIPSATRPKGLGSVYPFVQRMGRLLGHDVSVNSQPGKGSEFGLGISAAADLEAYAGSASISGDGAGERSPKPLQPTSQWSRRNCGRLALAETADLTLRPCAERKSLETMGSTKDLKACARPLLAPGAFSPRASVRRHRLTCSPIRRVPPRQADVVPTRAQPRFNCGFRLRSSVL